MKELPKGKDNVRAHIFSMIWAADMEKGSVVHEAVRRILNSFSERSDGRELADSLTEIIDYYVVLGYWRGYRDAKRHYQITMKSHKIPADRKNAERIVAAVLRANEAASTKNICMALDEAGVSGGFGSSDYFGPRMRAKEAKLGERWVDGHAEPAVVQWIYRIRKRVKTERQANAWLNRAAKHRPAYRSSGVSAAFTKAQKVTPNLAKRWAAETATNDAPATRRSA